MTDVEANVATALLRGSARGTIAAESPRKIRSPRHNAGVILDRHEVRWCGREATTGTSPTRSRARRRRAGQSNRRGRRPRAAGYGRTRSCAAALIASDRDDSYVAQAIVNLAA